MSRPWTRSYGAWRRTSPFCEELGDVRGGGVGFGVVDHQGLVEAEEHGKHDGTGSPYSFAVRGAGVAGEAESGQLPVEVDEFGVFERLAG